MYSFRYRILEENGDTVRAAGLCIELGNALLSVGKNGEAASFYQRAADLRSDYIGLEYVHAREKVASCQIGKNKIFKSFGIQSFLNVSPSIYSNLKKPSCLQCIEMGDYHNALVVLTDIANVTEQLAGKPAPTSVYLDILERCEILRVLLLLLIEPSTPQSMPNNLTNILEKYAWESASDSVVIEGKLYIFSE